MSGPTSSTATAIARSTSFVSRGLLTTRDVATQLGVRDAVVRQMRAAGLLTAKVCNGLGVWMYEPLEKQPRLDAVQARIRRSAAARMAADTRIARGAV